ncbi:antibiotic biosynthesis monooxygenase [uncultured Shimia sp.]|uniref:putative quinol monooxygenase n=1 Tax=uncultured Shimia sp. TaxID=573152 RepID=UPI0025F71EFE|nr:antibiotic biosynthesis monooxygenase [uncultured Shimia sp.]
MIKLTGYIDVPADRLKAVVEALPDHIALTRAETGCLSFEVTPDATHQGRFQVAELFVDRAAFDAHQTRTKASDWAKVTNGIPRQYEIEDIPE